MLPKIFKKGILEIFGLQQPWDFLHYENPGDCVLVWPRANSVPKFSSLYRQTVENEKRTVLLSQRLLRNKTVENEALKQSYSFS